MPVSIFRALVELEEQNQAAALCMIVRSRGSTPRHASSKMLVYPDGHMLSAAVKTQRTGRQCGSFQAELLKICRRKPIDAILRHLDLEPTGRDG